MVGGTCPDDLPPGLVPGPVHDVGFREMWRFFMGRPTTRLWLCDRSAVSFREALSSALHPPFSYGHVFGTPNASVPNYKLNDIGHTLCIMRHDDGVALGLILDGERHRDNFAPTLQLITGRTCFHDPTVLVRRTAFAYFPATNVILKADFSWLKSGALSVVYGAVNTLLPPIWTFGEEGDAFNGLNNNNNKYNNNNPAASGSASHARSHAQMPSYPVSNYTICRVYTPECAERIRIAALTGTHQLLTGAEALIAPAAGYFELNAYDTRHQTACMFCMARGWVVCECPMPLRRRVAGPAWTGDGNGTDLRLQREPHVVQRNLNELLSRNQVMYLQKLYQWTVMSVRHNGTFISSWRAVQGPPGRRVQSVLSTNVIGYFVFFKTGKEVYTACQKTFHDSGVSVASPRVAVLPSADGDFAEEEINVSAMPTSSMHVVESAGAVVVGKRPRALLQSEAPREEAMPLPRYNNASSSADANLSNSNDHSLNSVQSGVKRRAPSAYFEVPISDESWCGSEGTQINGIASMAAVGNHIATHSFQPARRRTAEPSATPSAVSPNLSQPEPTPLPPSSASPRSSAGTASTSTNVMRSEDAYASSPGTTKILECPECGLHIRGKRGNLNRHIATKHRNFRPFRCLMPDCGRALQSRLNLIRHMKKVHEGRPFRCSSCPRGFRSHDALIQHESGVHGGMGIGNGIGDFESNCENCGAKFLGVSALEEHRLECTAENPNGFQCATRACGKRFGTWTELARHRTNVHKNCTYTCSECSRGFQNEHDISRHIRLDHLQVQAANRCEECDSVFEKKSDLLRHSSLAHRESAKQRQR